MFSILNLNHDSPKLVSCILYLECLIIKVTAIFLCRFIASPISPLESPIINKFSFSAIKHKLQPGW